MLAPRLMRLPVRRTAMRMLHASRSRKFSSFSILDGKKILIVKNNVSNEYNSAVDDTEIWPRTHANTVLNICPKGEVMVVERLGELHKIQAGGYFFAIPVIDNIRFVIDMRERAINVDPQSCITKDNVHVQVSGNLYCQFVDPEKAAYGAKNPLYAVNE
jgi:hypothetical protein